MEKSTIGALAHYFGLRPGQKMSEFMAEARDALAADRVGWVEMLEGAGYKLLDK